MTNEIINYLIQIVFFGYKPNKSIKLIGSVFSYQKLTQTNRKYFIYLNNQTKPNQFQVYSGQPDLICSYNLAFFLLGARPGDDQLVCDGRGLICLRLNAL